MVYFIYINNAQKTQPHKSFIKQKRDIVKLISDGNTRVGSREIFEQISEKEKLS